MKTCILRKVVYRPTDSDKLTWGIVLCQNAGVTMLFVPRRTQRGSHAIALTSEDVHEQLFEDVQTSQFPVEDEDLCGIGNRLCALGDAITEAKVNSLLEDL